jgi:RNA-directed DNA polymerase
LKLQRWSGHNIEDIARALNPVVAGWVNYYGHFGRKQLYRIQNLLDFALIRWSERNSKSSLTVTGKAKSSWGNCDSGNPDCLFTGTCGWVVKQEEPYESRDSRTVL